MPTKPPNADNYTWRVSGEYIAVLFVDGLPNRVSWQPFSHKGTWDNLIPRAESLRSMNGVRALKIERTLNVGYEEVP